MAQITPEPTSDPFDWKSLIGPAINTLGTVYATNRATDAQTNIANTATTAAQQAAQQAQFRPVGVTSRFGASGFQYDPSGKLIGAGYQVAPDIAAQREALLGLSGGALTQAQQAQSYLPQFQQAAGGLFNLGQQLLPSSTAYQASPEAQAYAAQLRGLGGQVTPTSYDPTAAAQQYVQQQQSLLAPGQEQQLAAIRNRLQQTGRAGLATGATQAGGLAATNPEMAAYYNAIAQQNAGISANADQIARANLQKDISFGSGLTGQALQTSTGAEELARQQMLGNISAGAGLFNTGAGVLGQGYGTQTAALAPWSSYLGGATTLEGLGQQALTTGTGLGSSASSANSMAGQLLNAGAGRAIEAQQIGTTGETKAIIGALSGAKDPIAQLIASLTGKTANTNSPPP